MFARITLTLAVVVALALTFTLARSTDAASVSRIYLPLLACPGCTGTGAQPTPTTTPGNYSTERLEVIRLVNDARVSAGCPATTINANLMGATQAWSVEMDTTSDYRHAGADWYAAHSYPNGVMENIGGAATAEQVFGAWMESPAHKRNLLWCPEHDPSNPSYDPATTYEVGIGHSNGYWTLGIGTVAP